MLVDRDVGGTGIERGRVDDADPAVDAVQVDLPVVDAAVLGTNANQADRLVGVAGLAKRGVSGCHRWSS